MVKWQTVNHVADMVLLPRSSYITVCCAAVAIGCAAVAIPCFLLAIHFSDQSDTVKSWSGGLFRITTHDFGNVAIGTKAVHNFELKNPFKDAIQLISVSSSCGCTDVKLSTNTVAPGETASVIAVFNTSGQFRGSRYASLTLRLRRAGYGTETVLLSIEGFIRGDIVLKPGNIEFGSVPQNQSVTKTVQLEYTGSRSGWGLTKIESAPPFIYAKAEEERRTAGKVVYRITATLEKDAPAGYIKDVLSFKTNVNDTVLIPLQGVIAAPVSVKPSPLILNVADGEQSVTKNIVLYSKMPFRISDIHSDDKDLSFTFARQTSEVQLVTVMRHGNSGQCKLFDVQVQTENGQVTLDIKSL